LGRRHPRERFWNAAEQQIHDTDVEQPEQEIELGPVGGAGERRDFARDPFAEVRRAVRDERRRDGSQDV
jgi:hypothetical protein